MSEDRPSYTQNAGCLVLSLIASAFAIWLLLLGLDVIGDSDGETSTPTATSEATALASVTSSPAAGGPGAEAGGTGGCSSAFGLVVTLDGEAYDIGAPVLLATVTETPEVIDSLDFSVSGPAELMDRVEVDVNVTAGVPATRTLVLSRINEEPLPVGAFPLTITASNEAESCSVAFELEVVRYTGTQ